MCTVRNACDPSELSQQVQPHVWGVCGEREWTGSIRDQLSHVEHPGLQNCCGGKGQPRVQTQQHEVFLNSLLTQEQGGTFQLIFQRILVCCQRLKYTFTLAYVLEHMMLNLEEFCSGNSVQLASKADLFIGEREKSGFLRTLLCESHIT